jgi:AraC-like DNA-binding protein
MEPGDFKEVDRIMFSCEFNSKREGEQFVPIHVLSCIVSGDLKVTVSGGVQRFGSGDIIVARKNQLGKFVKYPDAGTGTFKAINLVFDPVLLQDFSVEYHLTADETYTGPNTRLLTTNILLQDFFRSLLPYFDPANQLSGPLTTLKVKEALLLLLRIDPDLKNMFFDFRQPGKINLEEFMQRNYMFNVPIDRFAQLTGRSLAAFKRDFEQVFKQSPGKWLQQRRLQQAHYLISEKAQRSSDIYLDLGFEDLSHFSYAFKKAYGVAPSMM